MPRLQFLVVLILDDCMKLKSKGIIKVIELRNLCHLSMRNCNVSQVPCEIGNLMSLCSLDLSENTFSVLPESFSNLSNLESLNIDDCYKLLLLPLLPSNLGEIKASGCMSLDVMPFDSMQMACIFRSKVFKESFIKRKLVISLTEPEVPDWYVWCSYQNIGNVLSFVAPMHFDNQIRGVILCAMTDLDNDHDVWFNPKMHNETKELSHRFGQMDFEGCVSMCVMFCPLNNTTLVVEAGDTVVFQFGHGNKVASCCGLRLVYEDDVLDSKLVIKSVQ
ncbi:TMV resistance protein N [Tanacetum coccineum]